MRPGPLQIVACPHCQALARYLTLLSGNTLGARSWTDGKRVAPMFPRPPAVVKCRQCRQCYWLRDAREVGLLERGRPDAEPAWQAAPPVAEPTETEYYRAIRRGLAVDPRQERALRIHAWWRRNDAFRGIPGMKPARLAAGDAWRRNLQALAALLDEAAEGDRLMKAEVLRELGDVGSAKLLLCRVTDPRYASAARQIGELCDAADVQVRELRPADQ